MKQHAHVYVLDLGDGVVKVGHSIDPERRVRDLGYGVYQLVFVSKVYEDAERIERRVHQDLRPFRVYGERFRVAQDVALSAIEKAEDVICGGVQREDYAPPPRVVREIIRVDLGDEEFQIIDELRRVEKDIPTRSEMIRRLIERASDKKGRK